MKLYVLALGIVGMLLTGCASVSQVSESGFCSGLSVPMGDHAEALLSHNEKTPTQVLTTGVRVVRGFDAVCP